MKISMELVEARAITEEFRKKCKEYNSVEKAINDMSDVEYKKLLEATDSIAAKVEWSKMRKKTD